jgi:hypothetical protein
MKIGLPWEGKWNRNEWYGGGLELEDQVGRGKENRKDGWN